MPKSAADRDDAAALMRHSVMRDRATDYVNLMADAVMALAETTAQSSVRIRCMSWGNAALYEMKGQTSPPLRLRERRAHSDRDC